MTPSMVLVIGGIIYAFVQLLRRAPFFPNAYPIAVLIPVAVVLYYFGY